jgi:hypothetical protein
MAFTTLGQLQPLHGYCFWKSQINNRFGSAQRMTIHGGQGHDLTAPYGSHRIPWAGTLGAPLVSLDHPLLLFSAIHAF